jgi:hypothetical protein
MSWRRCAIKEQDLVPRQNSVQAADKTVQGREGQRRTAGRAYDPGISEVIMFVLVLYLPLPFDATHRTELQIRTGDRFRVCVCVCVCFLEGRNNCSQSQETMLTSYLPPRSDGFPRNRQEEQEAQEELNAVVLV